MKLAANLCTPTHCREGGGMITVPNGVPRFQFSRITQTMKVNGCRVYWEDIFLCNFHVAVRRNGTPVINHLPLCEFFRRRHVDDCAICQQLGVARSST
jgi:hypothetical protein